MTSSVSAEPTSAPRMPASSGSRLSPEVKNAQLNLFSTIPLSRRRSSHATSRSVTRRSASGVEYATICQAPGFASASDLSGRITLPLMPLESISVAFTRPPLMAISTLGNCGVNSSLPDASSKRACRPAALSSSCLTRADKDSASLAVALMRSSRPPIRPGTLRASASEDSSAAFLAFTAATTRASRAASVRSARARTDRSRFTSMVRSAKSFPEVRIVTSPSVPLSVAVPVAGRAQDRACCGPCNRGPRRRRAAPEPRRSARSATDWRPRAREACRRRRTTEFRRASGGRAGR